MKTLTLQITDMHCSSCAMRLEAIEDDLSGVISIKASYHKQTMDVTFDEAVLHPEQILDAIRSAGYTPAPLNP